MEVFEKYSSVNDCDILYINSEMRRGLEIQTSRLLKEIRKSKKKNVLLILITSGGNPDVAYKISRLLQDNYENFDVLIPGWCKSAGTLLCLGAKTIFFSSLGELGPLDIQMGKKDEIFEFVSGLDLQYGIVSLKKTAFSMFETYMYQTMEHTSGRVSLKTAADIAAALTQPYINRIAEQISPVDMGENVRSTTIAIDYGERLNKKSQNLKSKEALAMLVHGYSSHGFVIDLEESKDLFNRAEAAPDDMLSLIEPFFPTGWYPKEGKSGDLFFLNRLMEEDKDETTAPDNLNSDDAEQEQGSTKKSGASEGDSIGKSSEETGSKRKTSRPSNNSGQKRPSEDANNDAS